MKKLIIAFFVIAALFYLAIDKYEYNDYKISSCSASVEVELVGSYKLESPLVRGEPYHLRLELIDSIPDANLETLSLSLVFTPISTTLAPITIESEMSRVISISGKKVLLVDSINIPYEDYRVSIGLSNARDRYEMTCDFLKDYSEEYRFRLWDILQSV